MGRHTPYKTVRYIWSMEFGQGCIPYSGRELSEVEPPPSIVETTRRVVSTFRRMEPTRFIKLVKKSKPH